MIHTCQYDFHVPVPCGKDAKIHWLGLWLCLKHYKQSVNVLSAFGAEPAKLKVIET